MQYPSPVSARADRATILVFIFGLVVSASMVARSQVAGDQLNLLALGWLFSEQGVWIPYGNPTSGAGVTPGGASAIVVGLPLMLWNHHRAPALLIWLSHLVAYGLLDRWLKRILTAEERFLFALLYWLNPWRLYHSAFLWNPNYLFFFGAAHLSTAFGMRSRPRFWMTFWHILSLGIALQLEVVALPLAVTSLFLCWRRYIRVNWAGAASAAILIALSLIPWALAAAADPTLMAREKGFLGYGLLMIYPVYRGVLYWIRYSTLALSAELFCLDYAYIVGRIWMDRIAPWLSMVKVAVYISTLPLSIWAFFKFWRGSGRWWAVGFEGRSDRDWLIGVVRWSFLAGVLVFCIAPSTIMRWHVLALFHVAILPPVFVFGRLLRESESRWVQPALRLYVTVTVAMVVLVAIGAPMIRCGGDRCGRHSVTMPVLAADHPMLDDLGIRDTCTIAEPEPGGYWPSPFRQTGARE